MVEEQHEEIEVIDVEMTEHEIDEMIAHLMELKEHKTNVVFPIAADVDLSVTYDSEHPAPHEETHLVEAVSQENHQEHVEETN
ncbi:MAG: hypothetical protein ACP5NS_00080 [Candidatus Pacearchaeota archaeon]